MSKALRFVSSGMRIAGAVIMALTSLFAAAAPKAPLCFTDPSELSLYIPEVVTGDAIVRVPLYLLRASEYSASAGLPAIMAFRVGYDPDVLQPVLNEDARPVLERSARLVGWYSKSVDTSLPDSSGYSVIFSGGNTLTEEFNSVSTEITTFDNQIPVIVAEEGRDQENPFFLGEMLFEFVGPPGSSSPVEISDASAANRNAVNLVNFVTCSGLFVNDGTGACAGGPDVNGDGIVDAVDVALVVNAAFGRDVAPACPDINEDGVVNAVDVAIVINASLGIDIPGYQHPTPAPAPGAVVESGHQLFIGPEFTGTELAPVDFPAGALVLEPETTRFRATIYLHRAADAGARHPAVISGALHWDPAVLSVPNPAPVDGFEPIQRTQLLQEWYGKDLNINLVTRPMGYLPFLLSGGPTLGPDFETLLGEISGFDNQLPQIVPEPLPDEQNPFPLFTITFDVIGEPGESSLLGFSQTTALADRDGARIANSGAFRNTVLLGDEPAIDIALQGTLFEVGEGGVIPCAVVELTDSSGAFRYTATADENGFYFFEPIPLDFYSVRILAPGYAPQAEAPIDVVGNGAVQRDFFLTPSSPPNAIIGGVTDEDTGFALVGVLVRGFIGGEFFADTFTCANGRYELRLPPGKGAGGALDVTLEFSLPNYETGTASAMVDPAAGAEVDEELKASALSIGVLAGVVRGHGATVQPLEGARVVLQGPINTSTETDAEGRYRFDTLLDGSYSVRASKTDYQGQSVQRTVPPGGARSADFELSRTGGVDPIPGRPGDINGDGVVNAVDVQLVINAALGIDGDFNADINGDGVVNAIDVQLVINAALGIEIVVKR